MNKQTEALKMVTDILDDELWFPNKYPDEAIPVCFIEALKACKEALEQPAIKDEKGRPMTYWGGLEQSAQEPVAEVIEDKLADWSKPYVAVKWNKVDFEIGTKFYTHPAPSWQGLADFEIERMWMRSIKEKGMGGEDWVIDFARAIEQALRDKNGVQ